MNGPLAIALSLGFVLGLKHALDPDHMVAVSTIVSEQKSVRRSSLIGTFWGIGHTASLLAVGIVVILSQRVIPPHIADRMELAVAFMLVFLGIRTLRRFFVGWRFHIHTHRHGGDPHSHFHVHRPQESLPASQHHFPMRLGLRPFLVGMVHGLAGSGALMLLVLGAMPSPFSRLAYIATFGVGSIGGMLAMSALISLPFVFTAIRFETMNRYIQAMAGALSIGLGILLMWQHGMVAWLASI
ncbi:MAG TPA: hypothetical protein VG892_03865 [Terriglobales bacterium]|nr:hypothetical protein [Terriglobales bacterium]